MGSSQTSGCLHASIGVAKEGTVSERNGDKSRFGRERKRKIHERKRIRDLRKALEDGVPEPKTTALEQESVESPALVTVGPGQLG